VEVLVLHIDTPATVPAFANLEPHPTLAWNQEFLTRPIATPHERVKLLCRLGIPADDVLAWSQRLAKGRAQVVFETFARSSVPVLLLPVLTSHRGAEQSR
jgi:hypothetical protein